MIKKLTKIVRIMFVEMTALLEVVNNDEDNDEDM